MNYDLAVIGAGAGGIACAKEAIKYGLKTALIGRHPEDFGGTCLNKGCIPTKFLINNAKLGADYFQIAKNRNLIVEKIKQPLQSYLQKNKIDIIYGQAEMLDSNRIKAADNEIIAKNIIIASGSSARKIFDQPNVIVPEDLFALSSLPEKILIIGAGYIGIEFASMLSGFGCSVVLIEQADKILASFEYSLSSRLRQILEKKGISINTGVNAKDYNLDDYGLVVCAVGRYPNTRNLGLEKAGVALDEKGWVKTDKSLRTSIPNIYACGDVNGRKMLAYAAEYQAKICLENIAGKNVVEDYTGFADCVFCRPQIAKVGLTVDEANAAGIKFRVVKSNFMRFSAAFAHEDTEGFMQILIDDSDRIIGAAIISKSAADLISIFSLCLKNGITAKALAGSTFIHPALSEIIPLLLKD
jgi:dihydrolipoamide dehydrogenase